MSESLYRFFDKDNKLLYVGISSNWQQRLKQHYKDSDFHDESSYITLEHYETREAVEQAERIAIETEMPKYNKAFNPDYENVQTHILRIRNWVYSTEKADDAHYGIVTQLKMLFFTDELWTRKSTGPVAYYLQKYLPDWATEFDLNCQMCVNVFHSRQIESWADQAKKVRNAAN